MSSYPSSIEQVIQWFSRLPGIGYKSAERMVMKVLDMTPSDVDSFASALVEMKRAVRHCSLCNGIADKNICSVCSDSSRDDAQLCVVEASRDMIALERAGGYRGKYCVLGGKLSPLNGIGPEELGFDRMQDLVRARRVSEVIIATGSDVEGEATAVYASRLLKPLGIKVTRIAYGVPVGSSLDFADEATLMRALEGRREY
ncbi:MAG: recombination protein RecR [Candidatus Auribacter fodinae]|uniref:Recombination protein RecR n=1 Tax=Candidatus Auribacter fodinae TaxID=2093366 RepID=A0A3A4R545_9BACT|nr:MAG: recombination protein RecR [Candidatus Auribacter fodinae]